MDSAKIAHLQFLQAVIARMASNSFVLKGWAVTLVAGLFALSASDSDHNFMVVAYIPVLMFWGLDGYFLSQERRFRALYDRVRRSTEVDFTMDSSEEAGGRNGWWRATFSACPTVFYGVLAGTMLVVRLA